MADVCRPDQATSLIQGGLAGLVAFGRPFIANPDLTERVSASVLAVADRKHFYTDGSRGYLDYSRRSGK